MWHNFQAGLPGWPAKCVHMSLGRRDLASLKREPGKPGQPGSHVNQISKTYKNNIRGEISPLASQPGLPGQPGSYEQALSHKGQIMETS